MENITHNQSQYSGFPFNQCFTLIQPIDTSSNIILDNFKSLLGYSWQPENMDSFYNLIPTRDVRGGTYEQQRIMIFDRAFIQLLHSEFQLLEDFKNVQLLIDYRLKKWDGSIVVVRRSSRVIFNKNKMSHIYSTCLVLEGISQYFSPSPIQTTYKGSDKVLRNITKPFQNKVAIELNKIQPFTPTELDICEFYLEGNTTPEAIANMKDIYAPNGKNENSKPSTVEGQFRKIRKKGRNISPGLDTVEKVSQFLQRDGLIGANKKRSNV